MHLVLPFITFIHIHLASHLGELDEPREGHDVGNEPEDSVWWTYPEDGRTPWSTCLNRRCSPSECHLTNTDLVLDSRQAPEHSKSLSILQMIS